MLLSLFAAAILALPAAPFCRVQSVESPEELVRGADAIVVVRATSVAPPAVGTRLELREDGPDRIEFTVQAVLKGVDLPEKLVIPGQTTLLDDFNPGSVPYTSVRSRDKGGRCSARLYRLNAEYLFFLRRQEGTLTPYWSALAPTNEQLRGANDPWVMWVRGYLQAL